MLTFNEFVFADLRPQTDKWEKIPVDVLVKSQHAPKPNIDTELFDLISKSYSYVGGHVDFPNAESLPSNHILWYAVDVDGDKDPDAVKFGKPTPYGTKWTGGGSDGSPAGKYAYVEQTMKALATPGNYAEMSDSIFHIAATRFHIPCVSVQAHVEDILGKSVKWIGPHPEGKYPGYMFYMRELGGAQHMKCLVGRPNGPWRP